MNIKLLESMWNRTQVSNGHWLFLTTEGRRYAKYPFIYLNGKYYQVARLGLSIYLGIDYKDKSWEACHICVKKDCWNPLHVYQGSHLDNMNDLGDSHISQIQKRRKYCKNGHELTSINVQKESEMISGKLVNRIRCRTCRLGNRRLAYHKMANR